MWRFGFGKDPGGGGHKGTGPHHSQRSELDDDYDDEDEQNYDDGEDDEGVGDEEWEPEVERYDGNILSSDQEKSTVLITFKDLRNDGMFCDITFLCQGKEFRAHKVVVSAWSRWLRALLCEEQPSEDVISLDVFDPVSFGKVLDYMYGVPLSISVDTA